MILLLCVQAALAQDPTPAQAPAQTPAQTPAPSDACAVKAQADWIAELQAKATRASYECLAADESSAAALITALGAEPPPEKPERLSRALALWRLNRLEQAIPDEEARAYLAVDRRLLANGIRAFRGRKSPSPEDEKVFEQLSWYKPNPAYIESRLTVMDRENIAKMDAPPPIPKPEKPSAADAMEEGGPKGPPPPEQAQSGCKLGCATGDRAYGGVAPGALLGLWGLSLLRRRQRAS